MLGPKFSANERKALNLSAITQIEYCRNFIFKRRFPIYKLSAVVDLWRLNRRQDGGDFGTRLSRRHAGSAHRIEHGHRVYAPTFRNAFLKQYGKFSAFLRNEFCPTISKTCLRNDLDHLDAVRHTCHTGHAAQ